MGSGASTRGMDGYATKPIRKDVLEAELRRVLGLRVAEAA